MLFLKELKEKKVFIFGFLILIFLVRIIPEIFKNSPKFEIEIYTIFFTYLFLTLIPISSGAVSFEDEDIEEFVISLPLKPSSFFWTKFFSGFITSIFLSSIFFSLMSNFILNFFPKENTFNSLYLFLYNLLFIPSFISSLIFRKPLLSLISTPFIIFIFMFLFILPFLGFLLLISPTSTIFNLFIIIIYLFFPLAYGFLLWKKGIFSGEGKIKITLFFTIITLLISYSIYGITLSYVNIKFKKAIAEAKKSGIKTNLEEIIPPPVNKEENGATYLKKAFELIKELEKTYKKEWVYIPFDGKIPEEKITKKQISEWEKIMEGEKFCEFFNLVEKGTDMKRCRFDIDYKNLFLFPPEHLANMRKIERILCARTYIYISQGKKEKAFKSLKYAIKFGDCIEEEKIIISYLVRYAIDITGIRRIEDFLNSDFYISDDKCKELIGLIEKKNPSIKRAIEGEFLIFFVNSLENPFFFPKDVIYQNKKNKKINPFQKLQSMVYSIYYWKIVGKNDISLLIKNIIPLMHKLERPYYEIKEELKKLEKKYIELANIFQFAKHPINSFYFLFSSPFISSKKGEAGYISTIECAKISLALRMYKNRYGKYPDKIEEIVPEFLSSLPFDPFTGKSFVYRKVKDGFIVYSLGENQKDDGGERDYKTRKDDISFKILN